MNTKFTYDDTVMVCVNADSKFRPGSKGWVIGVFPDREKDIFDWLPEGVVYTIEFEDGEAIDVNEDIITPFED